MTTTFFTIQEKVNNEWKDAVGNNKYATRSEAIDVMASLLKTDENYSPQDFNIVEVEVVDTDAVLSTAAIKIETSLSIFSVKFDFHKYIVNGEGFLEMHKVERFPSFSIVEIRRFMKVLDEVNAELPEGYEVFFSITHECALRLFLSTPKKEETK